MKLGWKTNAMMAASLAGVGLLAVAAAVGMGVFLQTLFGSLRPYGLVSFFLGSGYVAALVFGLKSLNDRINDRIDQARVLEKSVPENAEPEEPALVGVYIDAHGMRCGKCGGLVGTQPDTIRHAFGESGPRLMH